jgi:hypothetical protein
MGWTCNTIKWDEKCVLHFDQKTHKGKDILGYTSLDGRKMEPV